ncbi:hypothetical protein Slin14017_G013620 [Septoria linicola]|nr:hypothetical protein Slin14017_G013620 [Septoria linicola]
MGLAALLYGEEGPRLLAVTWTWTALAIILYSLRAASAAVQPSTDRLFGLRWDFIWVTLALVATLTAQITTTVSLEHASGPTQGIKTISDVIYTGLVANCAAIFGMTFGRFAVVALLLSIHGPTYPNGKLSLWIIAISQFVINIIQVGFTIHQCSPVSRLWNITGPGVCRYIQFTRKFGYFTGSYGAFCDFYLACYPAALIVGPLQQLKPRIKVAAGGVVAGIAGIIKTVQLSSIIHIQYHYATIVMWILTETWFIIIFGSITTTRPSFVAIGRHIKLVSSGFFGSTLHTGQTDNSASMELSQRTTDHGSDAQKPISNSRQEHDLSEDEIALHESFAGCRPYHEDSV